METMMSSVKFLFAFSLALYLCFFTLGSARVFNLDFPEVLDDVPSNYTHVCNPTRFEKLGLKMSSFAYCDKSLPFDVRAKDLVDRMTLDEKVKQVGNKAIGVPRLGLPKYQWWSEALHGVSSTGPGTFFDHVVPGATSFPTVILTTASFNQSLWKTIGKVVSTEARAMYNLGRAGLTFWSPNINVVRDPRWGRIMETPGEDPYIVGTYSTNYVRGLQDVEGTNTKVSSNSRPLKVSSCCKHYAAYDLDSWLGVDRQHFDAKVTEQDMVETFIRPFEMCVKDGDASSVMCSFNRVNGIPTCADPKLLKDTIRGDWNLKGYIVSDCDSIEVIVDNHKWLGDTGEDAVAQVLKAGLDLDCGNYYNKSLANSVRQGKVKEAAIDRSLTQIYVVLMRLGYFDGSPSYMSLGKKDICSVEHIELATEAAREGLVLMKNQDSTLPLSSSKIKSIALIGPHVNATKAMIGNYAGVPCKYTSPLDAFSTYGATIRHEMGCGDIACKNDTLFFPAMEAAKESDATILFMGLDLTVEAEARDRLDLSLPGYQKQLISQVAQVSRGPVILVIMSGGPVDISFTKNDPDIQAIIWAGYPGEEGGSAISDVIYGKYNPGGRLPLTWYEGDYVDKLPMTSMSLRPVNSYPGRTYKFYDGSTIYPFGHGLSYTKFSYDVTAQSAAKPFVFKLQKHQHCHDLAYQSNINKPSCPAVFTDDLNCDENPLQFNVVVKNVGSKDGSDVVMIYSKPPQRIDGAPAKQVVGFERVFVKAGGRQKVNFKLNLCKSLGIVDSTGYKVVPSGWHEIMVGDGVTSYSVKLIFQH